MQVTGASLLRNHSDGPASARVNVSVLCLNGRHWVHTVGSGLFAGLTSGSGAGGVQRTGRRCEWRLRSVCTCTPDQLSGARVYALVELPRVG
jgi:hypothetical protein